MKAQVVTIVSTLGTKVSLDLAQNELKAASKLIPAELQDPGRGLSVVKLEPCDSQKVRVST